MRKLLLSLLCAASSMTIYAVGGMLPGYFSVSETKTVAFSQGNLQYQAAPTPIWRFATNQWDVVGSADLGNVYVDEVKCNNALIADDYTGWIDLFGGGTGDAPTKHTTDKADYTTFTDWGVNAISNGGNAANMWYTLSAGEWAYLFNTRTDAANKKGQAVIGNINGVVLLPDEWTLPTGLSFTPTPKNWTTNVYTIEQWQKMEANGAVFLPLAGGRYNGTDVKSQNKWGTYHSSTSSGSSCVRVFLSETTIDPSDMESIEAGQTVRLVHTAQVGEKFKAASGEDTLQYQVTALAPNLTVKVTQKGHSLKEGTDLVIPASVKYIGQTFTVTEIENGPQFGNAKTLSLPNSLTNKVNWWVAELSSLEAFIVEDDNPIYTVVGGVLYSKDKETLFRCPAKKAFTSADFQPKTQYLSSHAFYMNTAISDLVIPNTIINTELNTFFASSITSVVIPASLKGLGNGDFCNCAQLTSVTFENSAGISIAWDSFNNSKIIKDQKGDFKVIDSVAVKYTGTADTVVFPDSIVNIVYACISYSDAGSKTMTTVILPASIKALNNQFTSFNSASDKYPLLEKIICKAQDVPNIIGLELQINSSKDVTLVVPCGKVSDYTTATTFSKPFTAIEEGFLYNVTLKQTEGGTIAYTKKEECNEIELTATPDDGYEFVKWNDENTDATRIVAVNSDIEFSATFKTKPTAISQTNQKSTINNQKVIKDGQLLILHDGKIFNAVGQEVK